MKRSWKVLIPLLLVLSLALVACGGNEDEGTEENVDSEGILAGEIELPHPSKVDKEGETVGGTLNVGLRTASPFEGLFSKMFFENAADAKLIGPIYGSFTKAGTDFEIADGGYADIDFDRENKTATYKMNPDLTWSDGEPVKASDIVFAYEVMADKDYTGVRYDANKRNVVGMDEFHQGEADTISGLKEIDDHTLEVSFKEFYPGILWGAGTVSPEPEHYLKDIPVADLQSSDEIRTKPVSFGPFMISNVVEGEAVEYVPNPHWFGDTPKLDKIIFRRTNPDTTVEALESGKFDVITDLSADNYEEFLELENIELISKVEDNYSYVGFKLGDWDTEAGEVRVDPDRQVADVELRKAIAYSMDNVEVAEAFYNALKIPANTPLDPAHSTFWNPDQEGYYYNPDKANEILDAAGYEDIDGDGFREDPDGNELKLNFMASGSGEIAEPLAQSYIQNWQDIGLNIDLLEGRLTEGNVFFDMLGEDNPEIDLYMSTWGLGSNPDPSGIYGRQAAFNFPRYASEKNDELLARIASEDAFGENGLDEEYMKKAYHDWQKNMLEELPVIPTQYDIGITAVNKRVSYWEEKVVHDWEWEKVGLLQEEPVK